MKEVQTQGAFSVLPNTGFLRLPQVLKFIPVSKTSWFDGIRSGRYPKPVKLSERTSAWRCEDIRALIAELGVLYHEDNIQQAAHDRLPYIKYFGERT